MKKQKIISAILIMTMLFAAAYPLGVGALGSNPTRLDISVGSITITPDGASGGGLEEAETALNPDGYVITGNSETNTVTVQDGVTTEIELDGVNISNSAAGSSSNVAAPLSVLGSSKVSIKLSGVNSLTGSGQWSQGIALGTGADLYIDGSGELNVSGWVSGIGGKNSTTVRKGIIEINGGVIMASGTRGAGIGGAGGRNSGEIIINGGTVTAVSGYSTSSGLAAGIGDGVAPSLKRTNPVIINGGSVNSTIQGTPENENGEELRLITASVSGGAGKTFTLTSADGGENTAKADAEGKLYLYIPKTADFVSVMDGSTMHYAQELAQDVDLEVDFEQYSGAPCSCDAGGGLIVFNGENITVNTSIGEETVVLAASFKPAEACQYPVHTLSNIEYRLAADVTDSEAKINGKELTVYSEAADRDIGVIVTATVNGKEYSKSTAFHVTEDDSYAVDLAGGDIVISEISVTEGGSTVTKTHVTVGDTAYDFEDQSRPIRIFQSDSAPNNTIQIDRTVKGADIIFDNLTIAKTARTPGYCINVLGGAEVAITLSGNNEVIQNTELAYAAFFIGVGSTVTIKGEGSLYVKGGYANVAIGAPNYNSMGTLVIESGKITAVGGEKSDESATDAAPAIGVPVNGNMGGRLVLKGGFLDAHSADKSDRGDINAAVVIDGGSLVSPIEIYNTSYSKYIPKNSSGNDVYLTELTLEGIAGKEDIVYYVTEGSKEESAAISSALDENGKLYLYLPDDGVYRRIRAQLKGDSSTDYFKRMKASADTEENTGVLVKNPQGSIKTFYIVGQSNCVIDEESKTITVSVPSLTDLTSCKPSIDADGLEYSPSGAVNLQDNDEMIYSVILDNGESVEYTVKIDRVASSENDMTVLDIGVGDIVMSDNQGTIEITIGDVKIVPNPNGYIITGKTDANIIFIEKAGAPVVLRNLVIDRPVLSDFDVAPMTIVGSDVDIAIEGVNEISGNTENSALHLFDESGLSISGSGILTLRGGAGAGGVTADSQNHRFEIGDASVFIIDGENSEESQANPVNEAGEPLYPLIVTIADEGAANSELVYSDTRYNDEGEVTGTTQNVKMLSDGSARLSLYKSAGNYLVSVLWNGDVYYSEDRVSVSALSTPKDPVSVTLTIPSIKGLSFKDPQSSLEKKVAVILSGTNLGGDMVVTATGEKGEKVSASAAKKGDVWQAELTIPANKSVTGVYRWTLSAKIGDVEQELSETYYIDMWRKLAITTFSLGEGKQVGEAQIDHDEELVTVIVPYDVDLRTTNFRPQYEHTGDVLIGNWGGTTMNLLNPATASIAYERGAGDRTEYTIRAQKQETPVINEISFEQPADYNGGNVVITMTGENLDNLANASTDAAKRIVVSAAGRDVYVTRPIPDGSGGTIWQATVPVPDNATGAQTVRYPITITINGLEQTFTGEHEIIVPARIEALANITDFVFNDAEGNPIEAVSLEITDGTAGSVSGGTSGTPGKIAIVLPSGTNIAETGIIPSVTLENPKANLRIIDAEGNEYGAGDAIIFTETNVPVTLTVVSEDGENTMSYELEVAVQTKRKSSGKSKDESVTPGSVTFEAYAGGYEDSTFRPDNVITRAEAAALLARLDGGFDETVPYAAYDKDFWDVASGSWYAKYVGYLAGEGVITGYEDGSFCPNNQISRMEFAALLSRFAESTGIDLKDIEKELAGGNASAGSTSDTANAASSAVKNIALNALTASAAVSDTASAALPDTESPVSADLVSEPAVPLSDISGLWGEDHILGLADAGVVNGYEDGTFRPDGQTTRAETVTMLNRMLGRTMTDELRAAINNAENPFSDLSSEHWAYCDIMAATHSYTVKTELIGKNVIIKVRLK